MTAQDMDIEMNELADDSGAESRVYELGFHIDPDLPSGEVKKVYEEMRGNITSKGEVIAEGEPQSVQLAYTISRQDTAGRRDFNSAHFCWVAYEASAEDHADIVSAANADKRVIRFIDLLTTKDAARHSAELQELSLKTPDHAKEPEETLVVELDAALEHATV